MSSDNSPLLKEIIINEEPSAPTPGDEQVKTKPARLDSLDVFRGLTMGCMILVNSPGL